MSAHDPKAIIRNIERETGEKRLKRSRPVATKNNSGSLLASIKYALLIPIRFLQLPRLHRHFYGEVDRFNKEFALLRRELLQQKRDQEQDRDHINNIYTQLEKTIKGVQQAHGDTAALEQAASDLKARLLAISEKLRRLEEQSVSAKPAVSPAAKAPISETTQHYPLAESILESYYLRFQRHFRGEERYLEKQFSDYLPIIESALTERSDRPTITLLDVACGDGIFLSLCEAKGWNVSGIDSNVVMADEARERGLSIRTEDAIAGLEGLESDSIDVITAFQFVEHVPPIILAEFLRQAVRVLRPGGILLVETINPHTLYSLKWFHVDLTHERFIFPDVLGMLAETAGFASYEWKGVHPVVERERLTEDGADAANTTKLNDYLFGFQDYYLIAKKNG